MPALRNPRRAPGGVFRSRALIRNVVFDIGWVFLHLNYRPILELLSTHGAEAARSPVFLHRHPFKRRPVW